MANVCSRTLPGTGSWGEEEETQQEMDWKKEQYEDVRKSYLGSSRSLSPLLDCGIREGLQILILCHFLCQLLQSLRSPEGGWLEGLLLLQLLVLLLPPGLLLLIFQVVGFVARGVQPLMTSFRMNILTFDLFIIILGFIIHFVNCEEFLEDYRVT